MARVAGPLRYAFTSRCLHPAWLKWDFIVTQCIRLWNTIHIYRSEDSAYLLNRVSSWFIMYQHISIAFMVGEIHSKVLKTHTQNYEFILLMNSFRQHYPYDSKGLLHENSIISGQGNPLLGSQEFTYTGSVAEDKLFYSNHSNYSIGRSRVHILTEKGMSPLSYNRWGAWRHALEIKTVARWRFDAGSHTLRSRWTRRG